jgi:hypothetical protein
MLTAKRCRPPPVLPAQPPPAELRGAARKRPPPPPSEPRTAPEPPKGRGGELWQNLLEAAKANQHPDPEKFADSALRARERALTIKANKHTTLTTNKKPKLKESCGR